MNILISGASGFVGRRVSSALRAQGHTVIPRGRGDWDLVHGAPPLPKLEGAEAVIHLAGEPVAQRWTAAARRRIRDSRLLGTANLVAGLARLSRPPSIFVCASAIGFYGDRGNEELTESAPPGSGFLPEVCAGWEDAARKAGEFGARVVCVRIGIVLGRGGGALDRMLLPFRLGLGGRLGSGRQWMSWIHEEDLAGLIGFVLSNGAVHGAVNGTAPNPVTNQEFTKILGRVLRRPAVLPAPGFVLKALFGEMAEALLGSQRVLPEAAIKAGYLFRYASLEPALRSLMLG